MLKFADMLDVERIIDLESKSKKEALLELVNALGTSDRVTNADLFGKAILDREEILSTGIGFGIAIPHAKVDSVKDFVMGIGRSWSGIEFESFDQEPVNIIVMIGSSAKQKDDYVKILAKVSRLLKSEDNRNSILAAETPEEIMEVFLNNEI